MQDFRRLRVSGSARVLAKMVYVATENFPAAERFGLRAQIRRAVVSVGANIAEGCGRYTDKEFAPFLQNALGSLSELDFELVLAVDLDFLRQEKHRPLDEQIVTTKRELTALIARVRQADERTLQRRMEKAKPAPRKSR